MSTLKNSVQLIGNAGKTPELKMSKNGNNYAMLSIATTELYTNKAGEKINTTTWHNLMLWDKQAEIAAKYITKGSLVGIAAKLVNKTIEDAQGNKDYKYELRVMELNLLSPASANTKEVAKQNEIAVAAQGEDLPF